MVGAEDCGRDILAHIISGRGGVGVARRIVGHTGAHVDCAVVAHSSPRCALIENSGWKARVAVCPHVGVVIAALGIDGRSERAGSIHRGTGGVILLEGRRAVGHVIHVDEVLRRAVSAASAFTHRSVTRDSAPVDSDIIAEEDNLVVVAGVLCAEHCVAVVFGRVDVCLRKKSEIRAVVIDEALGCVGGILPGDSAICCISWRRHVELDARH